MPTRRTLLRNLGLLAVGSIAGCGSDPQGDSPPSMTPSPAPTDTNSPKPSPTPTPEPGWTEVASMPAQRTEIRGSVVDGVLYIVGGFDSFQRDHRSVLAYDPDQDTWQRAPPLPSDRHHPGVAVHDGVLYVIGGLSGDETDWSPHDTTWAFDGDGWEARSPMPTARGAGIAETLDGRIYVAGGSDAGVETHRSLVEVYDPDTDEWAEGPSMPYRTQSLGSGVLDGALYVAGGRNMGIAGGTTFDEFVRYDPGEGEWESLGSLPTPRSGFGLAVAAGRLWAIGGETSRTGLGSVDVYDPESGEWMAGPPLPNAEGRHGHVAASIDDTIYVAGGTFPPGATATSSVIALQQLSAAD